MNKYEKYKDSGIEWLGEIPESWEVKKLRYLCKITTGEKDTENRESNAQYPFFVRSQKVESISTYSYDGEAILTAGDGVGVCKVWHYFNGKFDFHQRVYMIYDFEEINAKYLFYYMKENFIHDVLKISAKSTVDSLRRHMFLEFKIAFPKNISEQTAIADYLDRKTAQIDELIATKERLLELYEEEKTAIINQAVTKGLPDRQEVKMKHSGIDWLGEIPEHWEVKKIKYVANINTETLSEKTNKDYLIKYIDIGNVEYGELKEKPKEFLFKNAPSRARRKIKSGDTLISTVRTYLKAILFIEQADENLIASTGFAVISPSIKFMPKYLFFILSSEIIIQNINANSVGISYPAINASEIGDFNIWLPSIKEQSAIVAHIEKETAKIDAKARKTKKLIELLKEYKTALISEVVTGKVKVTQ